MTRKQASRSHRCKTGNIARYTPGFHICRCTTGSERPRRCCDLPNRLGNIDRTPPRWHLTNVGSLLLDTQCCANRHRPIPYTLQWAGRCPPPNCLSPGTSGPPSYPRPHPRNNGISMFSRSSTVHGCVIRHTDRHTLHATCLAVDAA